MKTLRKIMIGVGVVAGLSAALAQAPRTPPQPPKAAKSTARAITPAEEPERRSESPTGGAVLCAANPFCLPPYMRPPGSTSGTIE